MSFTTMLIRIKKTLSFLTKRRKIEKKHLTFYNSEKLHFGDIVHVNKNDQGYFPRILIHIVAISVTIRICVVLSLTIPIVGKFGILAF